MIKHCSSVLGSYVSLHSGNPLRFFGWPVRLL